jgi:CheY-like chemotaxis protein
VRERRDVVLVVEDDPALRDVVELALIDAGFRVVTATDGRAALDRVAQELPGLILLDMKMPVMNGWEFARVFRARYNRRAPIVVLTAAQDARRRAEEVGAEGFLGKPFDLEELIETVERFLRRSDVPA